MMITFVMSGYETHKFRNSLIANIYACTPEGPDSNPSQTRTNSENDLKRTVSSKEKFNYTYCEALWAWLITSICCCFRGASCYRKYDRRQRLYQEASKRLGKELNLPNLLHTVRMTDFIADTLRFKTHQQLLIHKQKKF